MNTSESLLFELGCEELPPKSLKNLSQCLLDNILLGLKEAGLNFQQGHAFATPRRLAVIIEQLDSFQADKIVEKRGPAVQAAYAADGSITKAALGFASSCGVAFDQLQKVMTDKGEWLVYQQAVKGRATIELLPEIIVKSLNNLPIAKRMRWGDFDYEFARPVHWSVLLFGNQVVNAEFLGSVSSNTSRGHRFHAPQAIPLTSAQDYQSTLKQQGKVLVDFAERMDSIRLAAEQQAEQLAGYAHIEEDLLEEIAALNEWPVPIVGNFDPRFLELPKEVLITTMQSNQKYFPVKNAKGGLLPYFITFSNIESSNANSIKHGNERVVLPRLADAEFFWKQDRKYSLADRVASLANIVFQKDLGTLADKTARVGQLAAVIAEQLAADVNMAKRAALLAKTDLLSNMVGEFANLQGIMGHYYALADGEAPEVALALEEHYFPKQSGAVTPSGSIGQALALADKIDTLAGIFSVGLIPTGDKDPYALRRATLGVLRIIIENNLDLDVLVLLDAALKQFSHPFNQDETRTRIADFIFDRLKGYCLDQGFSADEYEAVLAVNSTRPLDFMFRIRAVKAFRLLPEAQSLAAANKRISNILKKSDTPIVEHIGELQLDQEKTLLADIEKVQSTLDQLKINLPCKDEQYYTLSLTHLAGLRDCVDAFFDHVMVNTDDLALRNSRLALLAKLANQFLEIADIGRLQL